jgi:DNA-nicking Smr family endonuclease
VARKPDPFNNPFSTIGKSLKKELEAKEAEKAKTPPPPKRSSSAREEPSDERLFERAMRGTAPIHGDPRGKASAPPPPDAEDLPFYDEDAEALAELAALVDGEGKFDITDSDEFIEGSISGLDRRIVQRLRRGDYAVREHLDLHGMTRDVAREAVDQFIYDSRSKGHRCVLIVHGRGLNSKDKIPVLKGLLHSWLERGRISRSVLAFATARPHDGGAGAVYVLLRRLQK